MKKICEFIQKMKDEVGKPKFEYKSFDVNEEVYNVIAKEFSELPYKKKVCFVPFKTDEKDLFYMDFKENFPNMFNWTLVNNMAREIIVYYNPIDLLINGEIIKLNYTN